jgi:beta-N-acetylhexosaminidase
MNIKAIIISLSGLKLSATETKLIINGRPWGIILFKRNIYSLRQTKKLIDSIKKITKNRNFPILIDEEGGRVCRLSNFLDNSVYSQKFFSKIYVNKNFLGKDLYINYIFSMCSLFKTLGININTVPVLDLLQKKTHNIIGDRSYSYNVNIVKLMGNICVNIYKKNFIGTVMKHIPGHGAAMSDSHFKLPIVNKSLNKLMKEDFHCFKNIKPHFAMTAHILYSKLDSINPATHSSFIIKNIIRKKIGFKGMIISDDISMKSLKFDLITNAKKSIDAGCNLVLYCAGKSNESSRLLKELPYIDSFTEKKTSEFYKFLS